VSEWSETEFKVVPSRVDIVELIDDGAPGLSCEACRQSTYTTNGKD